MRTACVAPDPIASVRQQNRPRYSASDVRRPKRQSSAMAHTPRITGAALLSLAALLMVMPGFNPVAQAVPQGRALTFADRVASQRAIEEVYWRQRIWPKERSDSKPSLDRIMPREEIEAKVADYLRDSQLLEKHWRVVLTAQQLQSEMERMAQHTQKPEVLGQIFAALGNDPYLIAECLAGPALSSRLLTQLYGSDQRFHGELRRRAETEMRTHRSVEEMKRTSGKYREMEWIRTESEKAEGIDSAGNGVEMNSREWNENTGKLAALFRDAESDEAQSPESDSSLRGDSPSTAMPFQSGRFSSLQEDDERLYAIAVLSQT